MKARWSKKSVGYGEIVAQGIIVCAKENSEIMAAPIIEVRDILRAPSRAAMTVSEKLCPARRCGEKRARGRLLLALCKMPKRPAPGRLLRISAFSIGIFIIGASS